MKKIAVFASVLFSTIAFAGDVYHQGYTRKDGSYVQPHYQTAPDSSLTNNYSSKGNYNPYTGKEGTVDPYKQPSNNGGYNDPYNTRRTTGR